MSSQVNANISVPIYVLKNSKIRDCRLVNTRSHRSICFDMHLIHWLCW